jgi:hypothetical protein
VPRELIVAETGHGSSFIVKAPVFHVDYTKSHASFMDALHERVLADARSAIIQIEAANFVAD